MGHIVLLYGVILSGRWLRIYGYLGMTSEFMYASWEALNANILVGVLSAIVDNIPVMFAVITMILK